MTDQRLSAEDSSGNAAGSDASIKQNTKLLTLAYQGQVSESPGEVYAVLYAIKQMLVQSKLDEQNLFMLGIDKLEQCIGILDQYMTAIERDHSAAAQDVKKDLPRSREELSTSSASVGGARVANSTAEKQPVSTQGSFKPF